MSSYYVRLGDLYFLGFNELVAKFYLEQDVDNYHWGFGCRVPSWTKEQAEKFVKQLGNGAYMEEADTEQAQRRQNHDRTNNSLHQYSVRPLLRASGRICYEPHRVISITA